MQYLLITCGCAECRGSQGEPLIEAKLFDTLDEAKEVSWLQGHKWEQHPQGGWFASSGQGDDWILEVPDGIVIKPGSMFKE